MASDKEDRLWSVDAIFYVKVVGKRWEYGKEIVIHFINLKKLIKRCTEKINGWVQEEEELVKELLRISIYMKSAKVM